MMLEGFRFGAPGSPSPLKRAKLAPTEETRVATHPAEDSWHVSDSVEADDADADDADAVTSTGVVRGERRGRVGETNEGDASGSTDGRGEAHAEVVDGVVEQPSSAEHAASVSPRRETDRRRRWTYGDAVDADAACAARDPKNPNRFFLPRGHPGRPNPPPADWRARLDALRRDADSRAAPVVRLLRTVRSAGSDTSGAQAVGISGQPSSAPSSASSSIVFLVLFSCRTSDGPRVACSLLAAASQRA